MVVRKVVTVYVLWMFRNVKFVATNHRRCDRSAAWLGLAGQCVFPTLSELGPLSRALCE